MRRKTAIATQRLTRTGIFYRGAGCFSMRWSRQRAHRRGNVPTSGGHRTLPRFEESTLLAGGEQSIRYRCGLQHLSRKSNRFPRSQHEQDRKYSMRITQDPKQLPNSVKCSQNINDYSSYFFQTENIANTSHRPRTLFTNHERQNVNFQ